jgi:T-complex protein 1 subunit gamma
LQVKGCIGTKFIGRWSDLAVNIALDAVNTVLLVENGRTELP